MAARAPPRPGNPWSRGRFSYMMLYYVMWSYYIQYMVGQMPPSMPEERTHFFFHRKAPLEKSSGLGCSPFLFLLSTKRTCLCTTGSYLTWVISLAVLGTRRVLLYPVFAVDTNCTIVVLAFAFAILSCLSVCFSCSAWTLFRQPAYFCYVLSCPALLLLASPLLYRPLGQFPREP